MLEKTKYTTSSRFKFALVIFSFMGQVAWVVENMYFNVFIYKMFNATATDISLMVSASAVTAALTTLLIGALSDRFSKRKIFISLGYIVWGVSILSFSLIKMDFLTAITGSVVQAASLGVSLVIIMDCVMTFFGSSANDACFNAWLTDCGSSENRGAIEGINSMMPLVAILAVFGGFMAFNLDESSSWTMIFTIIGCLVILIGILGFFIIEDHITEQEQKASWGASVIYSFRPSIIKQNKLLYIVSGAFALFGISIQIFMPYLILYYEKSLGMTDYVIVMAPAIILAAVATAFYGKTYDLLGFQKSIIPPVLFLCAGYVFLFLFKTKLPVFIGSFFMMTGYLTGMAIFGAMIREKIPEDKTGMFQGIRIIAQVFVPGIIGPAIGAAVLKNAEMIVNDDGTKSFLPNRNIYLAAFIAAIVLLVALFLIFKMMRNAHNDFPTKIEHNSDNTESEDGTLSKNQIDKENSEKSQKKAFNESPFEKPFQEYPRPQMKRNSFLNLNGKWLCNDKSIIVPFPPQSTLSGFNAKVPKKLVYKKEFSIPADFVNEQVLLHFGAVDQVAKIYVDNKFVGSHEGGYLPFWFDITELLDESQNHTLKVVVTDTLDHFYPYGKQRKNRGGMWYTPVSGIWQTVWLESVSATFIENLNIKAEQTSLNIRPNICTNEIEQEFSYKLVLHTKNGDIQKDFDTSDIQLDFAKENLNLELWTPENPILHEFTLRCYLKDDSKLLDEVKSYFALRTVEIKEFNGVPKILLNGKPVFLHAVLDQGYFPDGIFLPPCEKGFENDIKNMKALGFNTLRKHIKVEPEVFYYYCDKFGMLVMQDMVNNLSYNFVRDTALPTIGNKKGGKSLTGNKEPSTRTKKGKAQSFFIAHSKQIVEQLYNHPSVVYYTIFNEGWGQFSSSLLYEQLTSLDHSRIFDSTSGWFSGGKTDVESEHIYFKTPDISATLKAKKCTKPTVISECGGYSFALQNHVWSKYGQYGYGSAESKEELTERIKTMYETMVLPAIECGLSGCVYTQLSDVEDEINGFFTYDRAECKVIPEVMQQISQSIQQKVERN